MDTPKLVFYEHNFDDSIIKSLSKNVLNLGNECRALAEENQRLKHEAVHAVNQIGGLQEENARLKAEAGMLEGCVRYWRIEAECDHGRWLRCLEDLEHLRNLK